MKVWKKGNITSDKYNQRLLERFADGKITATDLKKRLHPKRNKVKPYSNKQVRNFLTQKMGWMNTKQTKACKYLEYDHPAMEKVREYVAHQSSPEHPQPVHPRLILNIDQVWTMRFSSQDTTYFKPSAVGGSSLYIYICIGMCRDIHCCRIALLIYILYTYTHDTYLLTGFIKDPFTRSKRKQEEMERIELIPKATKQSKWKKVWAKNEQGRSFVTSVDKDGVKKYDASSVPRLDEVQQQRMPRTIKNLEQEGLRVSVPIS